MFSRSKLTIFALSVALSGITACSGNGSGETASSGIADSRMAGYWIEEQDVQGMGYKTNEDGSCTKTQVTLKDNLNNYFLEAKRIDPNGTINRLATITSESFDNGDWYPMSQMNLDGSSRLLQSFKNQWGKAGLSFDGYSEAFELDENNENVLLTHVNQKTTSNEGPGSLNETYRFFRYSAEEMRAAIRFSKDCASKQYL